MNQSQYTPGPWLQSHRKAIGGYSTEVYTPDGEVIATVAWYPRRLNETTTGTDREANARLIAAAPELLEALQLYMDAVRNTKDKPTLMSAIKSADNKARAAIAKATE